MPEPEPQPLQLTTVETVDGRNLTYFESRGIRLYRGAAQLRRLTQEFLPDSLPGLQDALYEDPIIKHQLSGLVMVGKAAGLYYGLDTKGLNAFVSLTKGPELINEGIELPDTLRYKLKDGPFVYFPTIQLLEKFRLKRRPINKKR